MRSNYGRPLRNYLKDHVHLKQIIDFGELSVFPEAATFPAMYLTEKKDHADSAITIYARIPSLDFKSLENVIASLGVSLPPSSFEGENWTLAEEDDTAIMQKMDSLSDPLGNYADNSIKEELLQDLMRHSL